MNSSQKPSEFIRMIKNENGLSAYEAFGISEEEANKRVQKFLSYAEKTTREKIGDDMSKIPADAKERANFLKDHGITEFSLLKHYLMTECSDYMDECIAVFTSFAMIGAMWKEQEITKVQK